MSYRSVPGKRPLLDKRPCNCFGCSNKKRPLPGKRPGNVSQDNIPYFLVIRRISLISVYSLISACYFAGLTTRY